MKTHTEGFKTNIQELGRELDSVISYGDVILGNKELNSVNVIRNNDLLKSLMKQLKIDSNVSIDKGTTINYKLGVKVNGAYEYINYGNFIVENVEKQEDNLSYIITCYDKMLLSMVDYVDLGITYPISIRDYINAICEYLGIVFKNKNDTFANYDKMIQSERYLDSDGNTLGYTFRDVFDELSQVTASIICINDNDDELEIRYPNETNDEIDEEFLKDINVKFGEKYGPVNSLVLSRSANSDNIYIKDDENIKQNGLCELRISDNQIMNLNDREQFLEGIFDKVKGLEFYINDFASTGICYYDIYDFYNIRIADKVYKCLMLNDEIEVSQGLVENVFTDMPEISQTDYSMADKTDRKINQAIILVDKQNAEIKLYVKKDDLINQININKEAIELIGNRLIVQANNLEIKEDGTLICDNATIRNGQLILEDDGTSNNAAISIKNTNRTYKNVEYRMDLSSSVITAVMPKDFKVPQENIDLILFASDTLYYISVKCEPLGSSDFTQAYNFSFYVTNKGGTYNEVFYNETLDLIDNKSVVNINKELTLPDDFGTLNSGNPSNFKEYLKKVIVDAGYTYYKANGISAKIYSTYKYTNADLIRCQYLIIHPNEITPEDLEFYDANKDGKLSIADMLIIMKNGGLNNFSEDNPGELILDTNASSDNLAFKDANGNIVASVGINGINAMARSNLGKYFGKVDLVQNCTFIENAPNEIGYWLDGSVIKRKSYVLENVEFSGTNTNILGIEIVDLSEVIRIYGTALNANGTWVPINMPYGNSYVSCMYSTTNGFEARSAWNWQKANIVIEYI